MSSTPRSDAAYFKSEVDGHVRVTALLAESNKLEREHTDMLEALQSVEDLDPYGPVALKAFQKLVRSIIEQATEKETA
tara:strand:+ start:7216 stop:7449 length:234 start_codon:yes stop_codon:yes gene_type:complete